MNPLPEYFHLQLHDELKSRRVVVWYDHGREFEGFVESLERQANGENVTSVKIHNLETNLAIYDGSYFSLRMRIEPFFEVGRPEPLLLYLPGERHDNTGSPLKELECAGKLYVRSLHKVAKGLLKRTYTEGTIDEMFRDRKLSYQEVLQLLEPGENKESASILNLVLGKQDAAAMIAKWLAEPKTDKDIEARGGREELHKLIELKCGLPLSEEAALAASRDALCRFLLVNEFRQDLECAEPSSLAMIPGAGLKEQREFVVRTLDFMRKDYAETYGMVADSVEQEFSLAKAGIPASELGSIDTFRFEERSMLAHVGNMIADGNYDEASQLIASHRRSYWAEQDLSRRQVQWELCATLTKLGIETKKVREELRKIGSGAKVLFVSYTKDGGWHRMDSLHRQLETQMVQLPDEPEAEKAIAVIRAEVEKVLRTMAETFGSALQGDKWSIEGSLHQTQIYPQKVESLPGKVAWFHVDAMRFEMAHDLASQLPEASEVEVTPAVAALPSITPICMAALLPGASASYAVVEDKGKASARIGKTVLGDVGERMSYLKAQIPDAGDITLEKVLQTSIPKLKGKTDGIRLLVVRSQEIDSLGEKHELLARQLMDTVIGNLTRAVRRLHGLGYESFVITADHGHQFSTRKEDDMKLEAPSGGKIELHRRCWIGRGPGVPDGAIHVSAEQLGYESTLDFVFPTGLGVFKAGGGLSYHHGGFSLQELVIPVLSFRMAPSGGQQVKQDTRITLEVDFTSITNRIFSVKVEREADLLNSDPVSLKLVLVSSGEIAGSAQMAPGANFDSENKVLNLSPGDSANVVIQLTKDTVESVAIIAQDAASSAVYAELKSIPIKLKS